MLKSVRSVVQIKPPELNRTKRRLSKCGDLGDVRLMAKRNLPAGVFDYIDGGAEEEISLARNTDAFREMVLHPSVLRDVADIDTSTELFGTTRPTPVLLAPTGFTRIADPAGELAVVRAAKKFGMIYSLSTLSTRSIEDVAAAAEVPLWFQVYVWKDHGFVREMIDRSAAAGYEALVVTVDTAVLGRRERDIRRGFTLPPKIGLDTFVDGALHPRWTLDLIRNEPITFANVVGLFDEKEQTAVKLGTYINTQFDQSLSWDSMDYIREAAAANGQKVIIKGVQRIEDAKRAASEGLDALILSNHGGRQIDGTLAPVEMVRPVKDVVGDSIPVIADGGIRRGSDIVKALALGADQVMIGRPYLYGLGAAGQQGVEWVLNFLMGGMKRTMALCGRTRVADLGDDLVTFNVPAVPPVMR